MIGKSAAVFTGGGLPHTSTLIVIATLYGDVCRDQLERRLTNIGWITGPYNPADTDDGMYEMKGQPPPDADLVPWVNPANKKKPFDPTGMEDN